jgi:hypothetical protein
MNVPGWVAELAQQFWADAGILESFPRRLRDPLLRALPVDIVLLSRLHLDDLRAWLRDEGIVCRCDESDRPLRACLVAGSGFGVILLDGTDPEDEQRFSLAHEVAHFLRHHWQPRRLACRHLGEQIAEVLDGRRAPTPQERLHALLRNVPLGVHLHLMRRGPRRELSPEVVQAEEDADRLAYELLAPAEAVLACTGSLQGDSGRSHLAEVLHTTFGLPAAQAEDYSHLLLPPVWRDPLLLRLRP